MSLKAVGVHARIKALRKQAVYTHCCGHNLTVFSLLNALGVYIYFLILGWASIGEGRLFKKLDFLSNSLLSLWAIQ